MRIIDWCSDVCSSDLYRDLAAYNARECDRTCAHLSRGDPSDGEAGHRRRYRQRLIGGSELWRGHATRVCRIEGGRERADASDRTTLGRSEEHTSELQSLMRISYAVFCLQKKRQKETA